MGKPTPSAHRDELASKLVYMMRAASDGLLPREDGIPSDKIKDQNFREIAKGLDPEDERAKALMMALVRHVKVKLRTDSHPKPSTSQHQPSIRTSYRIPSSSTATRYASLLPSEQSSSSRINRSRPPPLAESSPSFAYFATAVEADDDWQPADELHILPDELHAYRQFRDLYPRPRVIRGLSLDLSLESQPSLARLAAGDPEQMTLQSADRQVGGRDINAHLYPLGRPVDMGEDAEMEAEGEEGPVSGAEGARLDREQGNDPLAAAFTQALRDANPSTDPHSPHYSSHPLYDDDEIGFVPTRFYLDRNNAPASSVQAAGQGEPLPEDERVLRVIRAHQESARQQQVDSDRMEGVGIRQHEDT